MTNPQPLDQEMTNDEREQLVREFEQTVLDLETIYAKLNGLSEKYPRLDSDKMFNTAREEVLDVSIELNSLANYINVASDENWQRNPSEEKK